VRYPPSLGREPLDGRLLLLLGADGSAEPRFQVSATNALKSAQVFGIDVENWKPGRTRSSTRAPSGTRWSGSVT